MQGLIAAGRAPAACVATAAARRSAICESLIAPGGSVRYSRTSAQTPVWVTAQALDRARRQDLPRRLSQRPAAKSACVPRLEPTSGFRSALAPVVTFRDMTGYTYTARRRVSRASKARSSTARRRPCAPLGARRAVRGRARAAVGVAEFVPAAHIRDAVLLGHFTGARTHAAINGVAEVLPHLLDPLLFTIWGDRAGACRARA